MPALVVRVVSLTERLYLRETDNPKWSWEAEREQATVFGPLTACALVDGIGPQMAVYAETITEAEAERIRLAQREK